MIKLVASDLDGTLLLNGAQSLPEELFPFKRTKRTWHFVCGSKRQTVCKYEAHVCTGGG